MIDKISYKEYLELCDTRSFGTRDEFHKKLEEYGIEARPYTAYQYYDSAGNYIGDSEYLNERDLLEHAYITIEEPPKYESFD